MNITDEDIKLAYKKLKSFVYYDNTYIFLRHEIARFEDSRSLKELDEEFLNLANEINSYSLFGNSVIDKLLVKINYKVLPKKFKDNNNQKISSQYRINIIANNVKREKYDMQRVTYLFDGDIRLHIISVLWLMKVGYILDINFGKYVYANRLDIDENHGHISQGLSLFKPYFDQYQAWRDNGISKAQSCMDKNSDTLIVNIDIKNFYHSSQISFEDIKKNLHNLRPDSKAYDFLTDLVGKIYDNYTALFKNSYEKAESILPIGILTSPVLANWYLRKFDNKVIQNLNPVYYGRYVDDITIVMSNKRLSKDIHLNENNGTSIFEEYFTQENGILKYEIDTDSLKLSGYENLFVQKDKLTIYMLEAGGSPAALENFKRNIRKNSSEFRFLPDEDEITSEFINDTSSVRFSESVNTTNGIEDINSNKFGASKFLAKKIFTSQYWDEDGNDLVETSNQLLTYFQGELSIEYYSLWEKIYTYFVVKDLKEYFVKFTKNILKEISKINFDPQNLDIKPKEIDGFEQKFIDDLKHFLRLSAAIPIGLNEEFFYPKMKMKIKELKFEISEAKDFRRANLIRHNYVFHPLINYSNLNFYGINLLSKDLIQCNKPKDLCNACTECKFELNQKLIEYSPRFVHFDECTVFSINNFMSKEGLNDPYLSIEKSLELYNRFNPFDNILKSDDDEVAEECPCIENIEQENTIKKDNSSSSIVNNDYFKIKANVRFDNNNVLVDEIWIKTAEEDLKKVRTAVANLRVHESDMEDSYLKKPNVSHDRQKKLFKLLNLATEEKAQLFVLPETSVPYSYLKLIAKFVRDNQCAVICGLEHWVVNNKAYNFIATILPFKIGNHRSALIKLRLKNHYSPEESRILKGYRYEIPESKGSYDLFYWRDVYFSCYNCFELANIQHRALFKSKVDFLVASEFNKDTNYFSNIVETITRDIHCYFIQVNNSEYGDTRITKPSKTDNKDILKLKGGENSTVLIGEIDVKLLREFQFKEYELQKDDKSFKPTPPDFDRENVRKRMKLK